MARGEGTRVKNLKEVRNLNLEINEIIDDQTGKYDDLSDGARNILNLAQDINDQHKDSVKYSKENQDLAKEESEAARFAVKYATSRNFLERLYWGSKIKGLETEDA